MAIDLAVNKCLGKWHCCGEKFPIFEHNPWLKSLKERIQPHSTWKPSDEQMKALEWQIKNTSGDSWQYSKSKELLEQLKKKYL